MNEALAWQTIASLLGGAVGQALKTYKNLPTWIPQFGMWLLGFIVYVVFNPPKVDGWEFGQYLLIAAVSALSVNGAASVVGLHPSMATDSR